MTKQNKEVATKQPRLKNIVNHVKEAIVGITRLAFLSAAGVSAYVLWFSSDSLTLKVIAGISAVHAAVIALAMSTKR